MHAHRGSHLDIAGTVVYEERLFGGSLLASQHHLEYLATGLHHLTLETEVEGVEVVTDGVSLSVEVLVSPLHHKGVRIRQQTHLIASVAQAEQGLQVTLGHMVHIAVPRVEALVHGQLPAHHLAQFPTEVLSRNPS